MSSVAEAPPGGGRGFGAPRPRTAPVLSPNREDPPMRSVTAGAAAAGRAPVPPSSRAASSRAEADARKGGVTACAG